MIQNIALCGLFLVFAAYSCQSKSNSARHSSDRQSASIDSINSKTPEGLHTNGIAASAEEETYQLDSSVLDRFESTWYCFAFGTYYRKFQKDAAYFPFEYTFQDSFGNKQVLFFPSVDSLVAWRLKKPTFFGAEHGDIDRIMAEGYPSSTFDVSPFEHLKHIPPNDSILVTYITPFSKSDYYFKKENGRWIVFRAAHYQYSVQAIKDLAVNNFEDFLLRFSSDVNYRLDHTKFPLKERTGNLDGEAETVQYRTLKQEKQFAAIQMAHVPIYMTIYPNFTKQRKESPDMYLTLKHEGCACGWGRFRKTGYDWALVETLNCSG